MRESRLSYICSSYSVLLHVMVLENALIYFVALHSLPDTGLFKLTGIILQVTTNSSVNFSTAFLGAFTNLRRATISFIMSVCPSAWNTSAPTGRIFIKFCTGVFFEVPHIRSWHAQGQHYIYLPDTTKWCMKYALKF